MVTGFWKSLGCPLVVTAGRLQRTNPCPKSSFFLLFLLEAMQIPPRRASKEEEPGKKEEPSIPMGGMAGMSLLGDSVTVGQQPSTGHGTGVASLGL